MHDGPAPRRRRGTFDAPFRHLDGARVLIRGGRVSRPPHTHTKPHTHQLLAYAREPAVGGSKFACLFHSAELVPLETVLVLAAGRSST